MLYERRGGPCVRMRTTEPQQVRVYYKIKKKNDKTNFNDVYYSGLAS